MHEDAVFRAVADPTRRAIIRQLAEAPRDLSITEIAASFGSTRQAVTKHVDVLAGAGLVVSRKEGRERLCRPQLSQLKRIYEWAAFYEQFWTSKLHALGRHLDATEADGGERKGR